MGGCVAIWDPRVPIGPVFFACYAQIIILRYSRNVEYSNCYWNIPRRGNPLGGPPQGPWGLPMAPQMSQSSGKNCKNSQILYKNFTCIKILQIITLSPILGNLNYLGGALGGQKVILLRPDFFLVGSIWSFRQNTLYLSQVSGLGGHGA